MPVLHEPSVIEHPRARISVCDVDGNKRSVRVEPTASTFTPVAECMTSYQLPLIDAVLSVKGPEYLCDEILRDESEEYVRAGLERAIFSFVPARSFADRTVLDFGCGSGASTMNLARLLPETAQLVGVDLVEELLHIARLRAEHHGFDDRTTFQTVTADGVLPAEITDFDYVVLNAVFEHLLPEERASVLPDLWGRLRPGGVMFINETPHRWFPVEGHTTGLPLINYLPARLAGEYARRLSPRSLDGADWPTLLRQGIRGGSVTEICRLLGESPEINMDPAGHGFDDHIDLWFESSSRSRSMSKRLTRAGLRLVKTLTGHQVVPYLTLALVKPDEGGT